MERVPRVQGERPAILAVESGCAPAQLRIVFDVVVYQDPVLEEFDACRRQQRVLTVSSCGPAGSHAEEGSHALGRPGRVVPHHPVEEVHLGDRTRLGQ